MDHLDVGRYWDGNADAWTRLSRAGYDVYRDRLNTPAFLAMLPGVAGLQGLDIGCGEGTNTRQLAARGARMCALDISRRFILHARQAERDEPLGIRYLLGSAVELPFRDGAFHFCTAFMSLMDIPENEQALREAHRVLRPGGFLQFSITHPCFDTPFRRNVRDEAGRTIAVQIGDYFGAGGPRVDRWTFGAAPPEAREGVEPFTVPRFDHTLSDWLNAVVDAGFEVEQVGEPVADDATVAACPDVQDTQVVGYFLHLLARKARR
ncbi:MAG: class I SAM-dependent methyltransferase [Armatimonadetes bacterium]|nr:class I SAM-dependent methyltransferase [Armatimonadota bacterium]